VVAAAAVVVVEGASVVEEVFMVLLPIFNLKRISGVGAVYVAVSHGCELVLTV
jgi:hypothetical protein